MKVKKFLSLLLALALLAPLTGCLPQSQPPAEDAAQQELVYPSFDPSQLVQASAQPVSMEPACPLSQENLRQIKELLPTLSGVLLPGQEMPVVIGGCPTLQLTFADGSQTQLYLDVSDEIDLAVDEEGPLPAPCYEMEEEQLAPPAGNHLLPLLTSTLPT